MKPFKKSEILGIVIIFLILVAISVPNFALSLTRSRDQVRNDDLGAALHALDEYFSDFGMFPPASPDGYIMACKKPGDVVTKNKSGQYIVNFIPCEWGASSISDVTVAGGKVYMQTLIRDPNYKEGTRYMYFSDGSRFQIFAALEEKDSPEYDPKIVALNIMCGNVVCNAGRSDGVPTYMTIQQYHVQVLRK